MAVLETARETRLQLSWSLVRRFSLAIGEFKGRFKAGDRFKATHQGLNHSTEVKGHPSAENPESSPEIYQ